MKVAALFMVVSALLCSRQPLESRHDRNQVPGEVARAPRLLPIDQSDLDESFRAFRTQLLNAIQARDAEAVIAVSVPELQRAFRQGLALPPEAFAAPAKEDEAWGELRRLLSLGGSFTTSRGAQEGRREFCAPYTYSAYPEPFPEVPGGHINTEGHPWVILGSKVPVFERPSAASRVLVSLSYALVMPTGDEAEARDKRETNPPALWYNIVTPDNREGWVRADQIRAPEDFHACFAQIDGAWKMTVFERGVMPPVMRPRPWR